MSRARIPPLVLTAVLVLAGCDGGLEGDSVAACHATSTDLHITARNTRFDTDCLAIVANTRFTIVFENHDPGVPHSIAIYRLDPAKTSDAKLLFDGDRVQGPAITTYDVPALPAGPHFFRCEVHPTQMSGTVVVEG